MSVIDLPCDYEEWWDYQKLFILLSHVRSIQELDLLISSHTRADGGPSPTSKVLGDLKGLVIFLREFCTRAEQKNFLGHTLPFIARTAALLEERVPLSGIPSLQQQENSALVLGRKVIMSILSNAFLCTFPPNTSGDPNFDFARVFATFQGKDTGRKESQAAKLHCILCYFERAAMDKCNLSAVVTFRRQVLSERELPGISEWEKNGFPLCPFHVDNENPIDQSGDHALQVCFGSKCVGGGVLDEGCGDEEFRFCVRPELLIARLVMDSVNVNETIIVTGAERFSSYSGSGPSAQFSGEFWDISERDVFGNLLNSLLTLDAVPEGSHEDLNLDPYGPKSIVRELNKSFVGFYCQQDRGDISTELLALSVKRGSLTFVAEDYPECGAKFNVLSHQSDLGNISPGSDAVSAGPKVVTPLAVVEPAGTSSPLSPIPEISETSSFPAFLADDIIRAGLGQMGKARRPPGEVAGKGEEETATKLVNALFNPDELFVVEKASSESIPPTPSMDNMANLLSSSILSTSIQSCVRHSLPVVVTDIDLEGRSNSIARGIISDVLVSCPPAPTNVRTPQTSGEASNEGLSSMAVDLSGSILSNVLKDCSSAPPISIKLDRASMGDVSSMHEYISNITNMAIHDGIAVALPSVAREHGKTQVYPAGEVENLVKRSNIQNGMAHQGNVVIDEDRDHSMDTRSSIISRQGLSLTTATTPGLSGSTLGKTHDPILRELSYHELETPSGTGASSRLLTPMSTRTAYAWSIASTRDEDSRPVSPTDLNKLGLSLSNNSEEFSSLITDMVINNAISNVTGASVSPHAIAAEKEEGGTQDLTSLPSSSKIGNFLSTLGEAETPSDGGVVPYNTTWQNMRRQLLRPITTTLGGTGSSGEGGDPQLMAMIQWMAASASGRPRLFYYSQNDERVKGLAKVTSHLRAKFCTVGQLSQAIASFGKQPPEVREKCDLFTFLVQNT